MGGAPVYGSDAIAGTVNLNRKEDYEGLELTGQASLSDRGDAANQAVRALFGRNFAAGRARTRGRGRRRPRRRRGRRRGSRAHGTAPGPLRLPRRRARPGPAAGRSEERRVGKEWVSTCSTRRSPDNEKKKK